MDEGLGAAGLRLEVLEGSLASDDVLEAVALLLNSFWRRSLTARLASLRKSGRDLAPTSFVLVDDRSEMIVGHARVWWAARKPAGASGLAGLASLVADGSEVYVESVIIAPSLRGLGVGKALMAGVEQAVAEMFPSVTTWWLNTKDQALFYASIGFVETFDSVEHGSSVVVAADGETAAIHEAEAEAEHEPSSELQQALPPLPLPPAPSAPPPPPPPPALPRPSAGLRRSTPDLPLIWMMKHTS